MTSSPIASPKTSTAHVGRAAPPRADTSDIEVPHAFICPISQEVMQDPVFASDGFTYERVSIEAWLAAGHNTSPMTQQPLEHTHLTPNRTLRSEIQNKRSYVRQQSWGTDDVLERSGSQSAAPAFLAPPAPAPPAPPVAANASAQPQYEDICVLIDDLRTELLRVTQALAPLGMTYKHVSARGHCAVVTLSRRLSVAEAQGKQGYEYLNVLTLDNRFHMSRASETLCHQGWSFERFERDQRLMKTCFKRPMTGPAGMRPVYEEMSTLTVDNIDDMTDNARRMLDAGWSYQRFEARGQMQKIDYRRRIPSAHGQVTISEEKSASVCENNAQVVARVADEMAAQNWSFDRWDDAQPGLMVLHFKRNLIARDNGDIVTLARPKRRVVRSTAPHETTREGHQPIPSSRFYAWLKNPFRR